MGKNQVKEMIVVSAVGDLLVSARIERVVVACGVFDGVHRGHQKILKSLLWLARENGASPVVLTFAPHPRAILTSQGPPPLLTVRQQQLELFSQFGVKATVIIPFSSEVAAMSPCRFMEDLVFSGGVGIAGICVGAGWRFGAGGQGDTRLLQDLGDKYRFPLLSVPEFFWYGLPISSTRIRQCIRRDRLSAAARMLGRRHAVRGRVVRGRGIGKSNFNCPTANLRPGNVACPGPGVYAAWIRIDTDLVAVRGDLLRPGIVFIGAAPTVAGVKGSDYFIECHIFDFCENLYDREIEVELVEKIRRARVFPDSASLAEQITQDIKQAKYRLASDQAKANYYPVGKTMSDGENGQKYNF